MKRQALLIASLALVLGLVCLPRATDQVHAQAEPKVQGFLFYSDECPTCPQVRQDTLSQLYREHGQQLQIKAIDTSADTNNERWLVACALAYGIPQGDPRLHAVPALFIGDTHLIGADEIANRLPDLVQEHLDSGGVSFPEVPRPGGPLEPTVHFMFFYSPSCPHCEEVEEDLLPKIKAEYGDQVQWESYDRSEEANYRALLILGELTGLPQEARGAVPLVFLGDEYTLYARFLGSIEINGYLEDAIEWYMQVGGAEWPEWKDKLFNLAATPFPQQTPDATPSPATADVPSSERRSPGATEAASATEAAGATKAAGATEAVETPAGNTTETSSEERASASPAIHMAYFEEAGCKECDAVSAALEHLQKRYPNLIVQKLDIIDDLAVNLCLSERLNVPENQRHDAPAVFVGSDYLVAENVHYENLLQLVSKYAESGAEATWTTCRATAVELPPPPPWWAVILPGLGDGINPCAFATIIFFVSYLSLTERKGRDMVLVGAAFTLAVFLSYLAFGVILREMLSGLIDRTGPILRPILNGLTALLCLALAILSFSDFQKARQGKTKAMALRLPDRLRRWINATIRQSMKARTFIVAAFVAGVVVSFIELACTGQVYVPIILGLSTPGYRSQALVALTVYCLAFVVPLILVFIVSYMGTTSQRLGTLLSRHTATIKLITAVLFVAIGLWLIYDTLHTWGLLAPALASGRLSMRSGY